MFVLASASGQRLLLLRRLGLDPDEVLAAGVDETPLPAESPRRLALLGLEARVQTIAIDGEAIWHRVQVGPYDELSALNNTRVRLRENDIEAIALKVRKP